MVVVLVKLAQDRTHQHGLALALWTEGVQKPGTEVEVVVLHRAPMHTAHSLAGPGQLVIGDGFDFMDGFRGQAQLFHHGPAKGLGLLREQILAAGKQSGLNHGLLEIGGSAGGLEQGVDFSAAAGP